VRRAALQPGSTTATDGEVAMNVVATNTASPSVPGTGGWTRNGFGVLKA
jgi:hypothetical protein